MNNKTKIISCAVAIVLLAATCLGLVWGIWGHQVQSVQVEENGTSQNRVLYYQAAYIPNNLNNTWKDVYHLSADLGGGYTYTLEAGSEATEADVRAAADIVRRRAEMLVGSALTQVDGQQITLTVAQDGYDSYIEYLAGTQGVVAIAPYDSTTGKADAPILAADMISDAGYYTSNGYYYLQLVLNSAGSELLKTYAEEHAGETLAITLDGSTVGTFTVIADMDTAVVTANTQQSSAVLTIACARIGALPMALTVRPEGVVEPGNSPLDVIVLVCAIALLLCCVWMVLRARMAGVYGVWTLLAQLVVFFLLTALVALNADWHLNLVCALVVALCEAIFACALLFVMEKAGAAVRGGRGTYAAISTALNRNARLLLWGCGALLAIGLILMFAFQAAMYGVLGRVIAVSALVSLAMLYIFLKAAAYCCSQLTGSAKSAK